MLMYMHIPIPYGLDDLVVSWLVNWLVYSVWKLFHLDVISHYYGMGGVRKGISGEGRKLVSRRHIQKRGSCVLRLDLNPKPFGSCCSGETKASVLPLLYRAPCVVCLNRSRVIQDAAPSITTSVKSLSPRYYSPRSYTIHSASSEV